MGLNLSPSLKGDTDFLMPTVIELHVRGSIDDNSKINFLISQQNMHCEPSLKPSSGDSSNEELQCKT